MQRSAKRTAATAAATLALLLSGVGFASADETGETNGSILSGNNVDLDVLNNVTVCDIAGSGLIGFAISTGSCQVENEYDSGDGGDTTGDSNGSILSANNLDVNALNNLTVCDIAVAIAGAGAGALGDCEVENEFSDGGGGNGDETGESNGSIASANNLDIDALNNITVCDVAVAGLIGIAGTSGCEVENDYDKDKKDKKKKPPHHNGDNGNGDNGNGDNGNGNGGNGNGEHRPPPSAGGLPMTGAGGLAALAPIGLALVLAGVGLYRRFRTDEESA